MLSDNIMCNQTGKTFNGEGIAYKGKSLVQATDGSVKTSDYIEK